MSAVNATIRNGGLRLNRVYVMVIDLGNQEYRQRRWSWSCDRVQRWVDKANRRAGTKIWRVVETRLI